MGTLRTEKKRRRPGVTKESDSSSDMGQISASLVPGREKVDDEAANGQDKKSIRTVDISLHCLKCTFSYRRIWKPLSGVSVIL